MAESQRTQPSLQYFQCEWGDRVEGSKAQLQALGIGVGMPFPGEPGAPKRELRTQDPRGFGVRITTQYCGVGIFSARIDFPGWPERPDIWKTTHHVFPGIQTRKYTWFDEHLGSADQLAAAGLVSLEHLPGSVGMRKTRVSVRADGTPLLGPPTANHRDWRQPGARWIERASTFKYRVYVVVPEVEEARRRAADSAAERQWAQTVWTLPRPARLDMLSACHRPAEPVRRGHLTLVWSAPT